jgi:hypothetical protein
MKNLRGKIISNPVALLHKSYLKSKIYLLNSEITGAEHPTEEGKFQKKIKILS